MKLVTRPYMYMGFTLDSYLPLLLLVSKIGSPTNTMCKKTPIEVKALNLPVRDCIYWGLKIRLIHLYAPHLKMRHLALEDP